MRSAYCAYSATHAAFNYAPPALACELFKLNTYQGILMSSYPNTVETVTTKACKIAGNASSDLHEFINDVETLVKEATTLTGDDLVRAKAKLSMRLAAARNSVAEMGTDIAQRARNGAKATDSYVHEQPWKAIGAGAALGLLAGFALARR
jgi:ElaB/YqjD/DUF883 family membrane-anchored ribosome-binding protein